MPTLELRASIIIGSGSLSFEMVRALVERLPVMITPRWVATRAQPIAIDDVIAFLLAALDAPEDVSGVMEIGGADAVTYGEIMREYARQRGLRRWLITVPVLTPRLSSLWLRLVTPIHATVGRALIAGVRNETVVTDDRARRVLGIQPNGFAEAIARALGNEDREYAETPVLGQLVRLPVILEVRGDEAAPVHSDRPTLSASCSYNLSQDILKSIEFYAGEVATSIRLSYPGPGTHVGGHLSEFLTLERSRLVQSLVGRRPHR